ncbi:MAG: hypothetical protein R3E32_24935 [Chitinophagales bacterium]
MTPQEQHIDRIQKYLRGELPPNEMIAMKTNIEQNSILAQEVADYQFLIEGIVAAGAFDFEAKVASWEQKYTLDKSGFEEKTSQDETYTLDDLLLMFQPVSIYEKRIANELVGTRSIGGLKVVKPENEVDCLGQLTFELESPVDDVLKLTIENNEEDEVLQQNISANTLTFTIDLKELRPGRYYWKLRSKQHGMILRSFFVQKHLMP